MAEKLNFRDMKLAKAAKGSSKGSTAMVVQRAEEAVKVGRKAGGICLNKNPRMSVGLKKS